LAEFRLRPARQAEAAQIRQLIHEVGINPMDLDWQRFIVAVDSQDRMLGCGQLKPHGRDILELASLAVQPPYRAQGVARAIIEHLLAAAPRPVWLTCRSGLEAFYMKWGFETVAFEDMPPYFKRLSRLAAAMGFLVHERLLVMKLM
jgi:N-acetylglutamate synthase-like GNAT family acetyltransferase